MGTKLHLQLEDIYSDPYGFTYSEVAETIGEEQADKLYHNLYSGPNGKKQSTRKSFAVPTPKSIHLNCLTVTV